MQVEADPAGKKGVSDTSWRGICSPSLLVIALYLLLHQFGVNMAEVPLK
jgi:hypothetical protein